MNSGNDGPFWNWTRFIGMAHLLPGSTHRQPSVAHRVSLLSLLANQVRPWPDLL
jgi:hypothetical protein